MSFDFASVSSNSLAIVVSRCRVNFLKLFLECFEFLLKSENRLSIFFCVSSEYSNFDLQFILELFQILSSGFTSKSALTNIVNNVSNLGAVYISNYSFNLIISWEIIVIRIPSSVIINVRANFRSDFRTIVWNNNLFGSIVGDDDLFLPIVRNYDLVWYNLIGHNLVRINNLLSPGLIIRNNLTRSRLTRNI